MFISRYGTQWRDYLQYYLLTHNVCRLNRLQWVLLTSMLKTLAAEHRWSVSKMANMYHTSSSLAVSSTDQSLPPFCLHRPSQAHMSPHQSLSSRSVDAAHDDG
ncbi:MAG TPA: group II intron reverse transcriptase/maturase, partial [Gammaproteobacteria bacterium]|nr:group II intron reverse transcriptase/maturase [Gammaproteobacteria bacterium]